MGLVVLYPFDDIDNQIKSYMKSSMIPLSAIMSAEYGKK